MRTAVVAFDTRGGVQPYVALARGLVEAGHPTTVVTHEGFAELVTAHDVPVATVPGDPAAVVAEMATAGGGRRGSAERRRLVREGMRRSTAEVAAGVLRAAEGCDVVLAGVGGALTGRPVAERLGVPFVEAHLQPLGPPTAAFPGVLAPGLPAWTGGPGRRAGHRLTAVALRAVFAGAARQVRAELGLPSRPAAAAARGDGRGGGGVAVYGISPQVVPQPPEWGPRRRVCGYWSLPAAQSWSPPAELVEFLDAGPVPVSIGFGSMPGRDAEATTAVVLAAVRSAGVRAVLLTGWGGLSGAGPGGAALDGGDGVLALASAPHDWLFPRVAAVVHHGGAGTTGAALSAGVPALVVPHGVDQPFWGSRVAFLGAGPQPLPRRRLDAARLSAALVQLTTDAGMRQRAADLGARIRAEEGVAVAVDHLERHALAS
ncbi:glycosyltransferase [Quadrisphaera sp. KR29]|uniref:glycosyltransferase n=1 Tax=Quadrisphaera sp. KR29 TaxID=3461391 RepID=UPI004043D702